MKENKKNLESVISHLQVLHTWAEFQLDKHVLVFDDKSCKRTVEWTEDALELIKDLESVEPEYVDIHTWHCGYCNHRVTNYATSEGKVLYFEHYNFCPGCGRPVKWKPGIKI